ncbi:E3 ubiquitin-protein ligase trim71 [Mactra antiquata]
MAEDGNIETQRVQSTSETIKTSNDMDQCSVCYQGDKKTTKAVVLCLECSEYLCDHCRAHHHKLKLTRDHHLQGLGSDSDDSVENTRTDTEYCLEHPGNPILHYCETHDALCCKHCKEVSHRHCHQVQYIPDQCSGIMSSNELENVEDVLRNTKDKLEHHIEIKKEQNIRVAEQIAVALIQIKTEKTSAIEFINKLAETAEKEVQSKGNDISSTISDEAETCFSAFQALSIAENSLTTVKHNSSEAQVYISTKKANQTAKKYSKYANEVEENMMDIHIQFNLDSAFHSMTKTIKAMGAVTTGLEENNKPASRASSATSISSLSSYKRRKAIPLGGHSARIHGDRTTCYITGCELLEDGRMILADYNNKSMKVFDKYGHYSNHMFVSSRPTDIAVIGNEEIVTSLIDEVALQVLSIRKQIFLARRLETQFPYNGLAFSPSTSLLYGSTSFKDGTGEIHVMDLTGKILHSIGHRQHQANITRPMTLRINDDHGLLYVTDIGKNRVVCFDVSVLDEIETRSPVFQYTDRNLELRNGLAIDMDGNVYVCSGNRTIHQISSDGRKVHEVLTASDGIELPHCMSVSVKDNHLLLCEFKQNMFKLFALK